MTVCPLCGGTLRVIADITDPAVIDKILHHIRHSRALQRAWTLYAQLGLTAKAETIRETLDSAGTVA